MNYKGMIGKEEAKRRKNKIYTNSPYMNMNNYVAIQSSKVAEEEKRNATSISRQQNYLEKKQTEVHEKEVHEKEVPFILENTKTYEQIRDPQRSSKMTQSHMVHKSPSQEYETGHKISRLDDLLSRNDRIYQNLRSRLEEISKSNKNIDANISSIKPYSDSHRFTSGSLDIHHPANEHQKNTVILPISPDSSRKSTLAYFKDPLTANFHEQSPPRHYSNESISFEKGKKFDVDKNLIHRTLTDQNQWFGSANIDEEKESSHIKSEYHLVSQHDDNDLKSHQPKFIEYEREQQKLMQSEEREQNKNYRSGKKERGFSIHSLSPKSIKKKEKEHSINRNKPYLQQEVEKRNEHIFSDQTFEQDLDIDNVIGKTTQQYFPPRDPSPQKITRFNFDRNSEYSDLTLSPQKFHTKVGEVAIQKQSFVFIPFNKLYSSPIIELSKKDQIIISRTHKSGKVSKTNGKISEGIKYRYNNNCLILEQNKVYGIFKEKLEKHFHNYIKQKIIDHQFSIALVGGSNCLKKKLHIGFVAHAYNYILNVLTELKNMEERLDLLKIRVEHQETATNATPVFHSYESLLSESEVENQIIYCNVEALLEKTFMSMKEHLMGETGASHRVRVSKIELMHMGRQYPILNMKIVSTNKVETQFMNNINMGSVIWCVNPLFKYHEEALKTLASERSYRSNNPNIAMRSSFINKSGARK